MLMSTMLSCALLLLLEPPAALDGMVWIEGSEFLMGSDLPSARPDERPVHRVRLDGFWMATTEVTNAQFAKFVDATKYKTVAERAVDWEELKKQCPPGTPKPAAEMLQPGALVFTPPTQAVRLNNPGQWWQWVNGADWKHPEGPTSNIETRSNHPVVQISFEDALAYCAWAGKRLPTEAEWDFAARGGLVQKEFVWGLEPIDAKRANTWQGDFPHKNTEEDGFVRSAPVKSYPANGYGLFDMGGNVWEWTSDLYRMDAYARDVASAGAGVTIVNPKGPTKSADPRNPDAPETRVHRGGSFLCHASYCSSYRPSARMSCAPDTGLGHLGFRCVKSKAIEPAVPTKPSAQ